MSPSSSWFPFVFAPPSGAPEGLRGLLTAYDHVIQLAMDSYSLFDPRRHPGAGHAGGHGSGAMVVCAVERARRRRNGGGGTGKRWGRIFDVRFGPPFGLFFGAFFGRLGEAREKQQGRRVSVPFSVASF